MSEFHPKCAACQAEKIHDPTCGNIMHGEPENRFCTCGVGTDWENWVIGNTFVFVRGKV